MIASDYIARFLAIHGVTDTFGIPGGVVLDLMYALDRQEGITPHLCYHEQSAGFAACGYAQTSGKLGVAYATRGPGFTNLISAIADAYSDSIPIMFITGHSCKMNNEKMRFVADQELDTCGIVRSITKYAVRIDTLEGILEELPKAYHIAMCGRKGPVVLDVALSLWDKEIEERNYVFDQKSNDSFTQKDAQEMALMINKAERPVFLIGDGIHQAGLEEEFKKLSLEVKIPVISSRYSHDIIGNHPNYYGYIGSHGIRYSNFVLSKADLIISLGNRLCFPMASASYKPILEKIRFMRVEVDEGELERVIPNSLVYNVSLNSFFDQFAINKLDYGIHDSWIEICNKLKQDLCQEDLNPVIKQISCLLEQIREDSVVVNDVGNNEFWVSRACVYQGTNKRNLYSKSFGCLGNALGKAIGAYYGTRRQIVCFVGDQGLQMNIQELQFIAQEKLPIIIVILNNQTSGMIKDREKLLLKGKYLHTTTDSGYGVPDFCKISDGYGIEYYEFPMSPDTDIRSFFKRLSLPCIIEMKIDAELELAPNLPKGNAIQNMTPLLEKERFKKLNYL